MSKIIFVNRFFYPDQSATSQILSDLAVELVNEHRLEVVVLCSRRIMSDPSVMLSKYDDVKGVKVIRVFTTSLGKSSLIGRALDFMFFYITSFVTLLAITKRKDIIVAKTDPPLISVTSYFVSKIKGAYLVNWLQDIYPEVAIRLGVKGFDGLLGRLLTRVRNNVLLNSKCNVVLGDIMLNHVTSLGVKQSNLKVIHNWSDGNVVKPIDRASNSLISDWGLKDKFVVCYSGNMGRAHEFDTILGAIQLLRDINNIVFIFIGGGAKKQYIEDKRAQYGLDNIFFKPYQEFNNLSFSLSVGDVHLITLIPELEGLIVPSKLYGVLAAGRPALFIGAEKSEVRAIIEDGKCGSSFAIGDSESLATKIKFLCDNRDVLNEMSDNARSVYMRKYDKRIAFSKWAELLKEMSA